MVSPVHGNFIVNRKAARADDVFGLIAEVQDEVAQKTGIRLRTEVRIWQREPGETT